MNSHEYLPTEYLQWIYINIHQYDKNLLHVAGTEWQMCAFLFVTNLNDGMIK